MYAVVRSSCRMQCEYMLYNVWNKTLTITYLEYVSIFLLVFIDNCSIVVICTLLRVSVNLLWYTIECFWEITMLIIRQINWLNYSILMIMYAIYCITQLWFQVYFTISMHNETYYSVTYGLWSIIIDTLHRRSRNYETNNYCQHKI